MSIKFNNNKPIIDNVEIVNLKNEMIYSELPKDSMFVFSKTVASPSCTSSFSTDRGQLCLNDSQRYFIGEQRGLNKSYENYNF